MVSVTPRTNQNSYIQFAISLTFVILNPAGRQVGLMIMKHTDLLLSSFKCLNFLCFSLCQ